jgi:quaternary ammonium compound-resistance protein SugE
MAWIQLVLAGISEVIWVAYLKQTAGFTQWLPSIIVTIFAILSYQFLSMAVNSIPVGTAYAIWTGLATIGITLVAIVVYQEPTNFVRLVCIGLILLGVMGLRITTPSLD